MKVSPFQSCHNRLCHAEPHPPPLNIPQNMVSKPQARAGPKQAISSVILDIGLLLLQPPIHITSLAHIKLTVPSVSQINININKPTGLCHKETELARAQKSEGQSPLPEACVVKHTCSHYPGATRRVFYVDEVDCKCKLGVGWRLTGRKQNSG